MRREMAVLALAGLGLVILSCRAPCPDGQVCRSERHPCPDDQVCTEPLGDDVDGCANPEWGAALVNVKIELRKDNSSDRCVATLKPKHVCVMPGGAVRWKIKNKCKDLSNPDGVLEISDLPWLECDPKLTTLEKEPDTDTDADTDKEGVQKSHKNQLFCGVPDGQTTMEYEYGVTGPDFDLVDPWIEVRRGG